MRTSFAGTAVAGLIVAGLVFAGCGGQPVATTQQSTTTSLSTTTSVSSTTSLSSTTTEASTTTSAATTTTTLAEIIPGVPTEVYKNEEFGFSLARPQSTVISTSGFEGYLPLTQTPVVAFALPEELFSGTNLTEAGVYIGASPSAGAVSGWNSSAPDSGEQAAGTVEIDGVTFAVFTSSGAAAGNIYDEKVYRTVHGGACFELVELLHSGEIGNYPPGIKEFDRAKFEGYLEAMVHSFVFTTGG